METGRHIAESHHVCYHYFDRLCRVVELSKHEWLHSESTLQADLLSEFDRYRPWADNVGAWQQKYKLSLDYRLEDASVYRDLVSRHIC